jgi:hypothetical protein
VSGRNSWYQISLYVSLRYEEPESRERFAPEVMELKRSVDRAWREAGEPRDLALFMGTYAGIYHQRFFMPPTVGKHCPEILDDLTVSRIPAPRPVYLKNIIAGSDKALKYWYPEFDPNYRQIIQTHDI